MRLHYTSDGNTCRPLRIADGDGSPGALLGGRAPESVLPSVHGAPVRYFATVPLAEEPTLLISIFAADLELLMPVRGSVCEPGLVLPVVHAPQARSSSRRDFDSMLTEHGLLMQEPTADHVMGDEGEMVVRSGHKIGGRPYLLRNTPQLRNSLDKLWSDGFGLVSQFDFPSGEDSVVEGDWPFADGMFSLFGRRPFGAGDWLWYWDF